EVALDGVENATRAVFPAYPRGWALRVDDFSDPDEIARLGALVRWQAERAFAARLFDAAIIRWSPTANLMWTLLDRRLAVNVSNSELSLGQTRSRRDTFRQTGPGIDMGDAERLAFSVQIWARSSVDLARLAAA